MLTEQSCSAVRRPKMTVMLWTPSNLRDQSISCRGSWKPPSLGTNLGIVAGQSLGFEDSQSRTPGGEPLAGHLSESGPGLGSGRLLSVGIFPASVRGESGNLYKEGGGKPCPQWV